VAWQSIFSGALEPIRAIVPAKFHRNWPNCFTSRSGKKKLQRNTRTELLRIRLLW